MYCEVDHHEKYAASQYVKYDAFIHNEYHNVANTSCHPSTNRFLEYVALLAFA